MTLFCIVRPELEEYWCAHADTILEALDLADLRASRIDHGVLIKVIPTQDPDEPPWCVGLYTYEFGLYQRNAHYWTVPLNSNVFCGDTLLYQSTAEKSTIDFKKVEVLKNIKFYHGPDQLEAAIQRKEVKRPIIAINGLIVWSWPDPPDPTIEALMKKHGTYDRWEPDEPAEAKSE